MNYKVVIVDDEPLAIEVIKHYLAGASSFSMLSSFTNSVEALSFLMKNPIDLLFLDINMPVLNGIGLLKELKKIPLVIFTTAHKEFLQEGFDQGILDFLQKPIKKERLEHSLARAEARLKNLYPRDGLTAKILIQSGSKEVPIKLKDIYLIKAVKDYCAFFLCSNKKVLTLSSIKKVEEKLNQFPDFVRVHRSYIVPISKIESIQNVRFLIIAGQEIPIGRKYKANFYKKIQLT